MNMSKVVTSIKWQLHLNEITLPYKDENTGKPIPTDQVIMGVIKNVTIPEYSEFVPWIRKGTINIKDLKEYDKRNYIYFLPAYLTLTPVREVLNVTIPYHNNRDTYYGDILPAYGVSASAQAVASSQAYMMLAGQMRAEPTFEYLGENKIKLYGYPKTNIEITVAADHEPNGETIENTCYDSFLELALLDMKISLYHTLKLYDGQSSAFGEIKLKSEDFQGAEGERKELLNEWRDKFHVDLYQWTWM